MFEFAFFFKSPDMDVPNYDHFHHAFHRIMERVEKNNTIYEKILLLFIVMLVLLVIPSNLFHIFYISIMLKF